MRDRVRPDLKRAAPWIIGAIMLHAAYNTAAMLLEGQVF